MPRAKSQGRGLSGRAFALVRGVSHKAVQKAIRTGRLTEAGGSLNPDGTINAEAAQREWDANTDETKPRNSVSGNPKHRRAPGAPSTPAGSANGAAAPAYTAARAMRETFLARTAQLDYEQRKGKLVPVDEVKETARETARRTRDAILAVPDRLEAILASETDRREVNRLMSEELRLALAELSNDFTK